MSSTTSEIRARLGVPDAAKYVLVLDQAAHLDWDWIQTFEQYFLSAYSGEGVNGALAEALDLLAGNGSGKVGPYYYSTCEMGYLQKFVSYQARQGKDVVSRLAAAGASLRIVGGGITSPDNLICAGEAFLRNYLLGRVWLGQTLPGALPLRHCWIPDDFGQDPELPVAVQAMGMESIAFSRLPGTVGAPATTLCQQLLGNGLDFFWQASDPASKVYAHWMQATYAQGSGIDNYPGALANIFGYLQSNDLHGSGNPAGCYASGGSPVGPPYSGAPTGYLYVPIDNDFMMPITDLLADVKSWNQSTDATNGYEATGVYAVEASFDDFAALVLDNSATLQTVSYNGTPYWTGYYASRPALKVLHYDTVRWLQAAKVFGLLASPGNFLDPLFWQRLTQAWTDFMPSTHHDYICGTAPDWVYLREQLPLLQTAHAEAYLTARMALEALGSSIQGYGDNPVVIANPAGVAYHGAVILEGPVPAGMQGIQLAGGSTSFVQPTHEGGSIFLAPVASLGYTTGYLTTSKGTIATSATISPTQSGETSYTLANDHLTVVISAASNWGIESIEDSAGNSLLADGKVGNDLVLYEDGGDIYEFGNEYTAAKYSQYSTFESKSVTFATSGTGLGATVLEEGTVRVRLLTKVTVQGLSSDQTYTREYTLISGEPFLRMKTTGAAPSGYSVMTAFPLAKQVDTLVHGTGCHWTSVQPAPNWEPPIFQAAQRFLLPQAGSTVLGALYHRDVPAWAFTGAKDAVLGPGVLIGCLLRNTPGGPHGAQGTDPGTHTLHYALRTFDGLGAPTTGAPLGEALSYAMPPAAALIDPVAIDSSAPTLPESGFVASVESPGVILAAKPGDVQPGALVLRLYQPTNSSTTLTVTLGAGKPSRIAAVTALEDPIAQSPPAISITDDGFTIDVETALNTVAITA